jgi:hypothetical protein
VGFVKCLGCALPAQGIAVAYTIGINVHGILKIVKLRPELYHLVALSHVVRHLKVNPLPLWFLLEQLLASYSRPMAKDLAKVI